MQIAAETTISQSLLSYTLSEFSGLFRNFLSPRYEAIRRNGAVADFEPFNISVAATNALSDVNRGQAVAMEELQRLGRRQSSGHMAPSACGNGYFESRNPTGSGNYVSGSAFGQVWHEVRFIGACPGD